MGADDEEEVHNEIDVAFRMNSAYARRNNLLRVHVRFNKRDLRDEILKSGSVTSLEVENIEINFLKEIPYRVREKKRIYGLNVYFEKK